MAKRTINYHFLGVAVFLIAIGLMFLSTLSAASSWNVFGNIYHYLLHQLAVVAIGIVMGLIMYKLPIPWLKKIAPGLFFVNLLLMFVVFLPIIGVTLHGASRWIQIGTFTFQPSEFLKITAILYLASWLANRSSLLRGSRQNFGSMAKRMYESATTLFVPFLILLATLVLIFYLQRDISTLGIITVTLMVVYFMAQTPLWHTSATLIMGAAGAIVLVIKEPYRLERLMVFLHPEADPLGMGRQVKQGLIAIGSGGWFGKGLGESVQKLGFIPQAMSDSMFSILGEETGIVGCSILVLAFVLFLYLGFKIANTTHDTFSKLTVMGLCTWIVFQAFINIASNVGLFPLAGIPLPFFSYGGSHVIAEIAVVGLILNVSKNG